MSKPAVTPRQKAVAAPDPLVALIEQKSLLRGAKFNLAAGGATTFYFDMKRSMLDAEGARLIAERLLAALKGDKAQFVGGMELGAVPLIATVVQGSAGTTRPLSGFIVRKATKDHGTQRKIEGLADENALRGRNAVLLEDVTTTGKSVMQAVEAVRAAGGRVTKVVTVVDRLEGAKANLAAEGIELVALCTADNFKR